MARLQTLKLPKGVEIDEVSNDNLFTYPSARSVPTTLAVKDYLKDYLHDEIDKHDQEFMPDGLYRNAIINGGFEVAQRGESGEASGFTYCVDRFLIARAGGGTGRIWSRQPITGVPGVRYALRMGRKNGDVVTNPVGFNYACDEEVLTAFAGQTVTFSLYVRKSPTSTMSKLNITVGGSSSGLIKSGGTILSGPNLYDVSTSFSRVWLTFLIPADTKGMYFSVVPDSNTGVANEDWIEFAAVQLNIGDKPLPFAPRPIAEELALCQRYWKSSYAIGTPPGTPTSVGVRVYYSNVTRTNYPLDNIDFGNSMRTTPTVTIYSRNDGAPGYVYDYTDQKNVPVKSMIITNNGIHLKIDSVEGHEYGLYWAADAEL